MSNGSSSALPWVISGISGIVAALAVGFLAGRYTAPEAPAPVAQQQQQVPQQDPNGLPPGATVEKIEDWTLFCQDASGKRICFAMQEATNAQNELVMAVLAGYNQKAERTLLVRAPLGVALDRGVEFTVPGDKMAAFSFGACNQASCDAVLTIPDDNAYTKLETAGSFEVAYTRQDGVRVPATISMKGLTQAYTKIEKPVPPPAAPAEAAPATPPAEAPTEPAPAPAPN